MSVELRNKVLFFLALVSVAASYVGLSDSVPDTLWYKLFALIIAAGVGFALYTFWSGAFEAAVKPHQLHNRTAGWLATLVGAIFVLGISSWWNAAAIGGPEALRAALYTTLPQLSERLSAAVATATRHRTYRSRIEALAAEIDALMTSERTYGTTSGKAGAGGVVATLDLLRSKAGETAQSIAALDEALEEKRAKAESCIADYRGGLSSDHPMDKAASATDCFNAALADISNNGQLERIAEDMDGFTAGIVLPAGVRTEVQRDAVARVFASLQERAGLIATDARSAAAAMPAIDPVSVPRMSKMKAVVVYFDSVVPAWVTGIALDLLPLILLSFSSTMAASRREQPDMPGDLTIADTLRTIDALRVLDEVRTPKHEQVTSPAPSTNPVRRIGYQFDDDQEPDYWDEFIEIGEDDDPHDRRS
ncbi:hypothetical protein [Nitratireductor alexandrii]|uniref:hypothetical protein n=1 Tax=Nitratireductor alexandrii TaxID=2448161 RepID=UPI000FDA8E20|nr:hypothetical protein [Nitratireductor alexandrii]